MADHGNNGEVSSNQSHSHVVPTIFNYLTDEKLKSLHDNARAGNHDLLVSSLERINKYFLLTDDQNDREYIIARMNDRLDNSTILYKAVGHESLAVIKVILKYEWINPNQGYLQDNSSWKESFSVAKSLGCNPESHSCYYHREYEVISPLYLAVILDKEEVVNLLLAHPSVNIFIGHKTITDNSDRKIKTPLEAALDKRHVAIVNMLLVQGAGIGRCVINVSESVEMGANYADIPVFGLRTKYREAPIDKKKKGFEKAIKTINQLQKYLSKKRNIIQNVKYLIRSCNSAKEERMATTANDEILKVLQSYLIQVAAYDRDSDKLNSYYSDGIHPDFDYVQKTALKQYCNDDLVKALVVFIRESYQAWQITSTSASPANEAITTIHMVQNETASRLIDAEKSLVEHIADHSKSMVSALWETAASGDIEALEKLRTQGLVLTIDESKYANRLMYLIECFKKKEAVEFNDCSLEHDWFATINLGDQALLRAAISNQLDYIHHLVYVCGVNVEVKTFKGENVLHLAALFGHVGLINDLIKKANMDPNIVNHDGYNALLLAAVGGHQKMFGHLATHCDMDSSEVDNNGNNALLLAARYSKNGSNIQFIRFLVEHYNLSLQSTNYVHENILFLSIFDHDLLCYLVNDYSLDITSTDGNGNNILMRSISDDHAVTASFIVNQFNFRIYWFATNNINLTALHLVKQMLEKYCSDTNPDQIERHKIYTELNNILENYMHEDYLNAAYECDLKRLRIYFACDLEPDMKQLLILAAEKFGNEIAHCLIRFIQVTMSDFQSMEIPNNTLLTKNPVLSQPIIPSQEIIIASQSINTAKVVRAAQLGSLNSVAEFLRSPPVLFNESIEDGELPCNFDENFVQSTYVQTMESSDCDIFEVLHNFAEQSILYSEKNIQAQCNQLEAMKSELRQQAEENENVKKVLAEAIQNIDGRLQYLEELQARKQMVIRERESLLKHQSPSVSRYYKVLLTSLIANINAIYLAESPLFQRNIGIPTSMAAESSALHTAASVTGHASLAISLCETALCGTATIAKMANKVFDCIPTLSNIACIGRTFVDGIKNCMDQSYLESSYQVLVGSKPSELEDLLDELARHITIIYIEQIDLLTIDGAERFAQCGVIRILTALFNGHIRGDNFIQSALNALSSHTLHQSEVNIIGRRFPVLKFSIPFRHEHLSVKSNLDNGINEDMLYRRTGVYVESTDGVRTYYSNDKEETGKTTWGYRHKSRPYPNNVHTEACKVGYIKVIKQPTTMTIDNVPCGPKSKIKTNCSTGCENRTSKFNNQDNTSALGLTTTTKQLPPKIKIPRRVDLFKTISDLRRRVNELEQQVASLQTRIATQSHSTSIPTISQTSSVNDDSGLESVPDKPNISQAQLVITHRTTYSGVKVDNGTGTTSPTNIKADSI